LIGDHHKEILDIKR